MADIPLQRQERATLVQAIDEFLDAAPDVERDIWTDRSLDDPDETVMCVTDHMRRTEVLREVKERLLNATD